VVQLQPSQRHERLDTRCDRRACRRKGNCRRDEKSAVSVGNSKQEDLCDNAGAISVLQEMEYFAMNMQYLPTDNYIFPIILEYPVHLSHTAEPRSLKMHPHRTDGIGGRTFKLRDQLAQGCNPTQKMNVLIVVAKWAS
jgi:hypothetical protein